MGNTVLTNEILLTEALNAFVAGLMPLTALTADFSAAARQKGNKISVPRCAAATAAATFTGTYTMQDSVADEVEITLDQHEYVGWYLTDTQINNSGQMSLQLWARQKGAALAKKVLQNVLGALTTTNYGAPVLTGTPGSTDSDDLLTIRNACNTAGMPEQDRALILGGDFMLPILKDLKSAYVLGGSEIVRDGRPPRLFGFQPFESSLIPTNGCALVGAAIHPSGLAAAMRYNQPQDGHNLIEARPVTDPETGITFGYRKWYSADNGEMRCVLEAIFGKSVGITNGCKLIVSG